MTEDLAPAEGRPADGAPEDGERQRRRRRRGGRDRDGSRREAEATMAEGESPVEPRPGGDLPIEAEARAESGDGGGRRRGRGRQRGEERDAVEHEAGPEPVIERTAAAENRMPAMRSEPAATEPAATEPAATEPAATEAAAVTEATAMAEAAPIPEAARLAEAAPAAEAPLAVPAATPPAEPFALPIDELRDLARSAGLEWINSDAERILVAQQAIANEPNPVRIPRQPRPPVVADEGPLILVETRKDLAQLKLPFDQGAAPPLH